MINENADERARGTLAALSSWRRSWLAPPTPRPRAEQKKRGVGKKRRGREKKLSTGVTLLPHTRITHRRPASRRGDVDLHGRRRRPGGEGADLRRTPTASEMAGLEARVHELEEALDLSIYVAARLIEVDKNSEHK